MSSAMSEEKEDREDMAWLEALERGDSTLPQIDPERAETYQRMQLEISSLGEDMDPPDDWKNAVYAEMDRAEQAEREEQLNEEAEKKAATNAKPAVEAERDERVVPITRISDAKKSKRWMGAVASVAAVGAVAAAAVLLVRAKPENETQVASGADLQGPIAMVVPGEEVRRSAPPTKTTGAVGDKIAMSATQGRGELRLYLNGSEVVARCDATCATAVSDGLWRYEMTLSETKRGKYDAVFLRCAGQAPTGNLNKDLENCPGQGIQAPTTVELK